MVSWLEHLLPEAKRFWLTEEEKVEQSYLFNINLF